MIERIAQSSPEVIKVKNSTYKSNHDAEPAGPTRLAVVKASPYSIRQYISGNPSQAGIADFQDVKYT